MKPKTKKIYAMYENDNFGDVGTAEELAARWHLAPETIKWMSTPAAKRRAEGSNKGVVAYVVGEEPEPLLPQLRECLNRAVDRAEALIAMGSDSVGELSFAKGLLSFLDEYEAIAKKWEAD